MSFLVPAFLAGLVALSVPILVHLRHRQRKDAIPFPSLMFLRKIQFREVRRQQIHHWPLFLLRVLAVILLVLAFSRPFFRDRDQGASIVARTGRDVVVALDRSASMTAGDRWARAQAAARDIVTTLGRGDRAALVLFDASAVVAVLPTADPTRLLAAIDGAVPSSRTTRYGPAVRAIREVAFGADRPGREVVVISDFQRSGWVGEDVQALPEGTGFRTVDLSGPVPDVMVAGISLVPEESGGRVVSTLTAQLVAAGRTAPDQLVVVLELDGRLADRRTIEIPAVGVVPVRFAAFPLGTTAQRGAVRLERSDAIPANDRFHFLATAERPLQVVLRVPEGGDPARSFFRHALSISSHPRVEVIPRTGSISAADLVRADVVILDNVGFPGGTEGARLVEFVQGGGGLIHVLGERTASAWPSGLTRARIGEVVDRSTGVPATIGLIRRDHPIFEPFRLPRSGDFSATRVYRYRRVQGDSLEVLARYDDGAPALLEAQAGSGRMLILTSTADNIWSDLPLQPVFLPLAHQLVQYAGHWLDRPAAVRVGEVATVDEDALGEAAVVLVSPSGERTRRESGLGAFSFEVKEQGYHEVREARSGGRLLATVAANIPIDEFNLTPFDPADLALAAGAPDSVPAAGDGAVAELTEAERENAQSLWWYALAVVALLLLVEPMVAHRLTGAVRVVSATRGETP